MCIHRIRGRWTKSVGISGELLSERNDGSRMSCTTQQQHDILIMYTHYANYCSCRFGRLEFIQEFARYKDVRGLLITVGIPTKRLSKSNTQHRAKNVSRECSALDARRLKFVRGFDETRFRVRSESYIIYYNRKF